MKKKAIKLSTSEEAGARIRAVSDMATSMLECGISIGKVRQVVGLACGMSIMDFAQWNSPDVPRRNAIIIRKHIKQET